MTTLTVTNFLLARITDDERNWRRMLDDMEYQEVADRILRECKAKRRVLTMFEEIINAGVRPMSEGIPTDALRLIDRGATLASVVKVMATVYAHHPDYRDEWKP